MVLGPTEAMVGLVAGLIVSALALKLPRDELGPPWPETGELVVFNHVRDQGGHPRLRSGVHGASLAIGTQALGLCVDKMARAPMGMFPLRRVEGIDVSARAGTTQLTVHLDDGELRFRVPGRTVVEVRRELEVVELPKVGER